MLMPTLDRQGLEYIELKECSNIPTTCAVHLGDLASHWSSVTCSSNLTGRSLYPKQFLIREI